MREKLKILIDESIICIRTVLTARNAWIFIPVFLSFTVCYLAYYLDFKQVLHKANQEFIAICIISFVSFLLVIASFVSGWRFFPSFFFILALNFLIRELDATVWNFPIIGEIKLRTKEYIYFAIFAMAVWGFFKIEKITEYFNGNPLLRKLFLQMLCVYVISQAVARRVFRSVIPDERKIHISLEEITENFAHLSFLVLAIMILIIVLKKDEYADKSNT